MPTINDLTGMTFGRLTVRSRTSDQVSPSGRHRTKWICECSCGNTVSVLAENLNSGRTTSCGCYRADKNRDKFGTHLDTHSKLYGVWCSMKARCYNPNSTYYKRYGGRGIGICSEWKDSYETFRTWAISSGYHDGVSIDRIENDSGYSPSNCRWVGSVAQANNRSSNKIFTYNGETHNLSEWAKLRGINYKTLHNRIFAAGWDFERAITT